MTDPYRPALHFAPQKGWMNDPNGLIRKDGIWHLFFQHDPDSTTHGPMHWGHATSRDLLHWDEQPVALYPDHNGTCFSGSAIETAEGAVKLFYTGHSLRDGQDYQVQCLVEANSDLTAFTPYAGNPVVPNPGKIAFRDPKVIWHAPSARWIMLVTEGQSMAFYGSENLTDWAYLSRFGEGHGRHSEGPWECPDLVALTAPSGEVVWMLIVGVNPGGYGAGSGTQYFLGDFDGIRFTNRNAPDTTLWLDYGRDYYAAQTFFDRAGGPPVAIGWASNWHYAKETPTSAFRGVMSLPRCLSLVETPAGLRVAATLPAGAEGAFTVAGTARHPVTATLAVGERLDITLFGADAPQITITRTSADKGVLRSIRPAHGTMHAFAHDITVPLDWPPEGVTGDLYIDHGLTELCLSQGTVWLTNLHYPADPQGTSMTTEVRHG